jgi:hypothetical protein
MSTKKNSPIKQFGGGFSSGSNILPNINNRTSNIANDATNRLLRSMPFGSYSPNLNFMDPLSAGSGIAGQFKARDFNSMLKNPFQNALFGGQVNQDYGLGGILKNSQYARDQQKKRRDNEIRTTTNNKRLVDKGLLPPQPKPASTVPLTQLKSNNMEYNNINSKAFSNVDNIKNVMGEAVPNTFTRKVGNSPIKQSIDDPTDPMIAESMDQPLQPPNRIATPTTPPYDINNY